MDIADSLCILKFPQIIVHELFYLLLILLYKSMGFHLASELTEEGRMFLLVKCYLNILKEVWADLVC